MWPMKNQSQSQVGASLIAQLFTICFKVWYIWLNLIMIIYTIDWGTYVITNSNYKKKQYIFTELYQYICTFNELSENSETWMNIMVE